MILRDIRQGYNITRISRDHGVSRTTVGSIRDKAGLQKPAMAQEIKEQILMDLQQGVSMIQVRRKYKITQYTAERIRDGKSLRYQQREPMEVSIRVPKFRCPLCGTMNIRKVHRDDKICLGCIGKMKKK